MFSSLKTSITNILSPKTLLSNYIASTLSSYFLNVDSTQIEATLLSEECKKIVLKHVQLKPLYSSGVVVRGEVTVVEFSWIWGDRNNIITNVELMMRGVHVVITPDNDDNENKDEDYVNITMPQEEETKRSSSSGQDEKEKEEDDWKTKYFKQIIDHLTLILDDVSINVYLPPPPPPPPSSLTKKDNKDELVISFRGEHFEIISHGRQQKGGDIAAADSALAALSSTPLAQELILNSLSCFVVSIPPPPSSSSSLSCQYNEFENIKNGDIKEVEEEDEFYDAQEEDDTTAKDDNNNNNDTTSETKSSNVNAAAAAAVWEKEKRVTKSIQNYLLSRVGSSSPDSFFYKVYTLIAPFHYKTSIQRVSGQRFLDGIFTGLKVKGIISDLEEEEKVQMYIDVVQMEAIHRLGSLIAAIASSTLQESKAEEKQEEEEGTLAMNTEITSNTSSSPSGDENTNNFSLFILPFQFISLTLPPPPPTSSNNPSSSGPTTTTISMKHITCTYRTDGQLLTIQGTGGLSVVVTTTTNSSSSKEVEVIQKDVMIWNADMIASQLIVSPAGMISKKEEEKMTIHCPLKEMENIVNGLKRLMTICLPPPSSSSPPSPSSTVSASVTDVSSATTTTPWSMIVNGTIIFHLEAKEEEEEREISWMDIAIDHFCIKSKTDSTNNENDKAVATKASSSNDNDDDYYGKTPPSPASNALETQVSFKQIQILSSSTTSTMPLFQMNIPEGIYTTNNNEFGIITPTPKLQTTSSDEDGGNTISTTSTVSISIMSIDTMKHVNDLLMLYKNAVSFSSASSPSSGADSCKDGSTTNEKSSTLIPSVSIPKMEISIMDAMAFLGGDDDDKGATVCFNSLSTKHDTDNNDELVLLVDSLDIYECTSTMSSTITSFKDSNVDATEKIESESCDDDDDIMLSIKNICITLSSSLLVEELQQQQKEQDKGDVYNIIGKVNIGEVTKCLIPNIGYIASPTHNILLQLSKDVNNESMTLSMKCECIDFVSAATADANNGLLVKANKESTKKGNGEDNNATTLVSSSPPAVTGVSFLQLPCSIELNLDKVMMKTLEQQQQKEEEQHQKDCVVCHSIHAQLKPSSDIETKSNVLHSCSGIVEIGEISTLKVSGVCRLLEPIQKSTVQLENGVMYLKCDTIDMLKLNNDEDNTKEKGRKTLSDESDLDLHLPFPVCAAIQKVVIKVSCPAADHELICCSQIEMNLKPDITNTTEAAGEGGGGKLPFLGMIKIGEITTLNIPGGGQLTSPMKKTAIRLEHGSIGIRIMSIEALMSCDAQRNTTEPPSKRNVEGIIASYPQPPCPIRILCTNIAVQQVSGDDRKDYFRCTNVDIITWPGVGGGMPSGVLKIGEISELDIAESGRLSVPTHNPLIKFKNGTLQVEFTDVQVIKYDAQAQSGNVQLPLPINFLIAHLSVNKCNKDGHAMEWVCCSQISAEMKPAKQLGGLPTGTLNIGEVSKFVAEDTGRLLTPIKNTIIILEEDTINIKGMDIKVVKHYEGETNKKTCTSSRTEIADIFLPWSIDFSFTSVEVKQQDKGGTIDDWISCSSIEGNLRPDSQGKIISGTLQVGEIWTFKTPGSGYLLAPMCNSILTLEDNTLQINCKLISVIKIHTDNDGGALHENDSFDLTETKNWLPCPVKLGVESLSVKACDQFGVTQNLVDCSQIDASAKPDMEGHLPSIIVEISEILEVNIPGKGYLSAPTKNSVIRLEHNCVQVVLPSVKAVMLEHINDGITAEDSEPSFSLPLPIRLAVAELLVQQRVRSETEDFIECAFLDLDLKTIQGQTLPVGTVTIGEVSKLNVVDVFSLSSPLQNTIIRCGENDILVEIISLEGVAFDEYNDDDNNIEQSVGLSSSTIPKLLSPIRLAANKVLARKAPNRDMIPVDWICCSSIEVDLRPAAQSGFMPIGIVKIGEVSTLNFPSMGCLSAPVRDSIFRLEQDAIQIECKEIEAIKFNAPSSTNKEKKIPGEKDALASLHLPCRVVAVIEGLIVKEFVDNCLLLESILCCRGIQGDFKPSEGGLPSGRVTFGEVSTLVLRGSGCITAPMMNSTVELTNDAIRVECTNIEAITFESPPQQRTEVSKSIDVSLPCPIRILVGCVAINTDEVKCRSVDISVMPSKKSDMEAKYSGNQMSVSTEGSQISIHSIKNFELRNMMKVDDICAKASIFHDRVDVLHGVIVSAKCVELSADFSSIDWPGALLGKDDESEQSILKLPFASVGKMKCVLDYKGKVLSVSDAHFNVDAFVGDESTTSQTITDHYIGIVKSRLPALLGSVEVLGSNLTDMGAMHAGRALLASSTSSTAAMGSMVGLGVKDAFSGTIGAGKKSRGMSSDDKYKFGDFSRGVAASIKSAAKSGSNMRNDDRYVVGDFTAGSVAATGSYVKNNSERLSRAGGASAGMVLGAAVAGPLGVVAGSFMGGKVAGDTAKKLSTTKKDVTTEDTNTVRNRSTVATRMGNHPSRSEQQKTTSKNPAPEYQPPPPVAPEYTRTQGHMPAEGSVPSLQQTSGRDSSDDPFGFFSAKGNASERAGSSHQSQNETSIGLGPPLRSTQPRKQYQPELQRQAHGTKQMSHHITSNPRHKPPVPVGAGSQINLHSHRTNQSTHTGAAQGNISGTNQTRHHPNDERSNLQRRSAVRSPAPPPSSLTANQSRQNIQSQRRSLQPREEQGYRFGDITRSIVSKGKKKQDRDENDGYKFGDFTRGLFG